MVLKVYRITKQYPKEEMFGLISQLRRVVISVPANIAEGFAGVGLKDKLRFYNIAAGSLNEVNYYFLLAKELGYATTANLIERVLEIDKMLNKYSQAIKT